MSDQENKSDSKNPYDDDNIEDGEDLFKEIKSEEDQDKGDEKQKKPKKLKKIKKEKKSKKDKKKKKKRKQQQEEQQDYDFDDEEDEQRNSMFDEEAESDNQQQFSEDREAEIGQQDERGLFDQMLHKPRYNEQYYSELKDKNAAQLNARYSRTNYEIRDKQDMYPGPSDPKVFLVNVMPKHEDELALYLLNKARDQVKKGRRVKILTVTSMKKKYPSKIFVQAWSEIDLKQYLQGFVNIKLGQISQLDRVSYTELFAQKEQVKVDFKPHHYVRITKGLYQGDLAQISKVKANSLDVILVPRINLKQISMRIKQQTDKITDLKLKRQKQGQILNMFLDHKSNQYRVRPQQQIIHRNQIEQYFHMNPSSKKIKLADKPPGLITLNYKFNEVTKPKGTYLPAQIMPFSPEGNIIGKINEDKSNFITATNFKLGEEVQVSSGDLRGHFGIIVDLTGDVATILCKNKSFRDQRIYQNIDNLVKRFRQGDRVRVISGSDKGKTGIVLKIEEKVVQIWTDNNNSIKVSRKNLQISKQTNICEQNVHGLKKDDLIKTSKNLIGIVIETSKDNIKIMDTNNSIQIVNNMDFDSKINTRNIIAKNKIGDQISAGAEVIVRVGIHEGKKCKVIHVYRQNVFIFNPNFHRTAGLAVENAENMTLVSKRQPDQKRLNSIRIGAPGSNNKDQIRVGKSIILQSGPLKGYQGIVKSINKDKIQVRVPSKSRTEWVSVSSVAPRQETTQVGKTPHRKGGNTHNYVPSPTKY